MKFALAGALLGVVVQAASPAPAVYDKAFWRQIVASHYAFPEGSSVAELTTELSGLLGNPDPELRDTFGYGILTAWIYQKKIVPADAVRRLATAWQANLTKGVGATGTDSVFLRSFSALMLSVVVARDNEDPFLERADVGSLLDAALAYLAAEQDVRGYDARVGWMHSAAHTADLLKFLGRSRYLDPADQRAILNAVARKMREAPIVFTFGEDERYARAVLSLVSRKDFDADAFTSWVTATTPARMGEHPDPATLRGDQNVKNLYSKLLVLLVLPKEPPAGAIAAREALATSLGRLY
jgi:hypothetical protein